MSVGPAVGGGGGFCMAALQLPALGSQPQEPALRPPQGLPWVTVSVLRPGLGLGSVACGQVTTPDQCMVAVPVEQKGKFLESEGKMPL